MSDLGITDGAVTATIFTRDENFFSEVDVARVKRFMEEVKELRKK